MMPGPGPTWPNRVAELAYLAQGTRLTTTEFGYTSAHDTGELDHAYWRTLS